jgi:hypothetical protein
MANDMLRRWNIDAQCQKAVMVVMSSEDRSFWVARMPQVPVYGTELNDLFKAEVILDRKLIQWKMAHF